MRIIQLSDLHICSDENKMLFYENPIRNLENIIFEINKHSNISFVIITGDISNDGTLESYKNALSILCNITHKVYCIPGNHDNIENMKIIFNTSIISILSGAIAFEGWDFYYINTSVPGKDIGFINTKDLQHLEQHLSSTKNNTVVITHHHIFSIGTPLVDSCMVMNPEPFIKIVDNSKKAKLIMCGHVHGDYIVKRNHYILESAPATCFQWMKNTREPKIIKKIGYKIFTFNSESYKSECIFL